MHYHNADNNLKYQDKQNQNNRSSKYDDKNSIRNSHFRIESIFQVKNQITTKKINDLTSQKILTINLRIVISTGAFITAYQFLTLNALRKYTYNQIVKILSEKVASLYNVSIHRNVYQTVFINE